MPLGKIHAKAVRLIYGSRPVHLVPDVEAVIDRVVMSLCFQLLSFFETELLLLMLLLLSRNFCFTIRFQLFTR
jgi:hypothetical protein